MAMVTSNERLKFSRTTEPKGHSFGRQVSWLYFGRKSLLNLQAVNELAQSHMLHVLARLRLITDYQHSSRHERATPKT